MLAVVATDRTFIPDPRLGGYVGKCIHCRTKLVVMSDGQTSATVEHVLARAHGGTNDPSNLALACARCNHEKGVRHDTRRANDPVLIERVAALRAERGRRWREPLFPIDVSLEPAPARVPTQRRPRGRA